MKCQKLSNIEKQNIALVEHFRWTNQFHIAIPGMSAFTPESDSEDELPPAWEERATNDGYVYYVNHRNKSTQWTHPRTNKIKRVAGELPLGWEKQIEESTGKILFIDHKNKRTTYTDPRLAFAIEEQPLSVSQVRQRFDAGSTALQVLHGRDLTGKSVVITGGNCGIGFETTRSLALHGCEMYIGCRNAQTAKEAIEKITIEKPVAGKKCHFIPLDLASLNSVKEFADSIKKELKHIDILILNAAVMALPHSTTIDGVETTFQVCHLSHFYLTTLLEDRFDVNSRIIVVSSESHRFANLPKSGLTEQNLCPPAQKFWSMLAYNNVKLCNVLFVRELSERWRSKGLSVFSLHPGNMVSSSLSRNWWFYRLLFAFVRPFTKSLQQAASTTVYCATATELTGLTGFYFNNCYFCEPSQQAKNDDLAKELWELSEKMIKNCLTNTGNILL